MAEDFISSDDLAGFLELDELDLVLAPFAIDVACATVRRYLDQRLTFVADDEVRLDGSGTDTLRLPERPVRAVTLVTEDDPVEVDPELYFLRGSSLIRADGLDWWRARGNYRVTYDHGYDIPDESSSGDDDFVLPADIRLAALSVARRVYNGTGPEPISGLTGETIGAYSYTADSFGTALMDLLDVEKSVLARYAIRSRSY